MCSSLGCSFDFDVAGQDRLFDDCGSGFDNIDENGLISAPIIEARYSVAEASFNQLFDSTVGSGRCFSRTMDANVSPDSFASGFFGIGLNEASRSFAKFCHTEPYFLTVLRSQVGRSIDDDEVLRMCMDIWVNIDHDVSYAKSKSREKQNDFQAVVTRLSEILCSFRKVHCGVEKRPCNEKHLVEVIVYNCHMRVCLTYAYWIHMLHLGDVDPYCGVKVFGADALASAALSNGKKKTSYTFDTFKNAVMSCKSEFTSMLLLLLVFMLYVPNDPLPGDLGNVRNRLQEQLNVGARGSVIYNQLGVYDIMCSEFALHFYAKYTGEEVAKLTTKCKQIPFAWAMEPGKFQLNVVSLIICLLGLCFVLFCFSQKIYVCGFP